MIKLMCWLGFHVYNEYEKQAIGTFAIAALSETTPEQEQ